MKQIRAITDEEIGFELVIGDKTIPVLATEVMILWDEARTGENMSLLDRYNNFQLLLSQAYGVEVPRATAFFVMEEALKVIASLKKTLLQEDSLKSSASTPPENQPTN